MPEALFMLCAGLQSVRVDKLQNRAWSKASLPALAFLEEVAAQQQLQQQQEDDSANSQQGEEGTCTERGQRGARVDIRAIWEREWWLRKGQRKVLMRLNSVKVAPVKLDDYLTEELLACTRKCTSG